MIDPVLVATKKDNLNEIAKSDEVKMAKSDEVKMAKSDEVKMAKSDEDKMAKSDTEDAKESTADDNYSSKSSQDIREISQNTPEVNTKTPEASSIIDTRNIRISTKRIETLENEAGLKALKKNYEKLTPLKPESIYTGTVPKSRNTEIIESDDCVTITLNASYRQKLPVLRTKSEFKEPNSSAQVHKINPADLVLRSENEFLKASYRQKLPVLRTKSESEISKSFAQVPKMNPTDLVLKSENESSKASYRQKIPALRTKPQCSAQVPKLNPNNLLARCEIETSDIKIIQSSELRKLFECHPKLAREYEQFTERVRTLDVHMVEKSRKLLRKQTYATEMLSYIRASQSVCRLLLPRNTSVDEASGAEKLTFDFSSKQSFYSIGERMLSELKLYLDNLTADIKDWEARRTTILGISENIPKHLEQCRSEFSTRVVMDEISGEINSILQEMNEIVTKIDERNTDFTVMWEGIDGYIKFSSFFIMDKRGGHL